MRRRRRPLDARAHFFAARDEIIRRQRVHGIARETLGGLAQQVMRSEKQLPDASAHVARDWLDLARQQREDALRETGARLRAARDQLGQPRPGSDDDAGRRGARAREALQLGRDALGPLGDDLHLRELVAGRAAEESQRGALRGIGGPAAPRAESLAGDLEVEREPVPCRWRAWEPSSGGRCLLGMPGRGPREGVPMIPTLRRILPVVILALAAATTHAAGDSRLRIEVLVGGRALPEYRNDAGTYIEALKGREYTVRVTNLEPYRVAVAVSVDGRNVIDARRSSAREARKWILGPYESIELDGWQVSDLRARRFFFTTEERSYAEWLGDASNAG